MNYKLFSRADGTIGVGFVIFFGGVNQFSIAWPDKPCERFTPDMAALEGISVLDPEVIDSVVVEVPDGDEPSIDAEQMPAVEPSVDQLVTESSPVVAETNVSVAEPPLDVADIQSSDAGQELVQTAPNPLSDV